MTRLAPIALALLLAGCARHEAPTHRRYVPDSVTVTRAFLLGRAYVRVFESGDTTTWVLQAWRGMPPNPGTIDSAFRVKADSMRAQGFLPGPGLWIQDSTAAPDTISHKRSADARTDSIPVVALHKSAPLSRRSRPVERHPEALANAEAASVLAPVPSFDLTECAWTPPVGAPPPPGRARVYFSLPCSTGASVDTCDGEIRETEPMDVYWAEVWGRRCCDICPRRLTFERVPPCREDKKVLTWDPGTDVYDVVYVILTDQSGNQSCPAILYQPRWPGDPQ